jgi:SpoVK/Ycf46/Vps4 family AAA+-type ATPase
MDQGSHWQPATSTEGPPWSVFADLLLYRAALVARVAFDHRPNPLAGLRVDHEDLSRLLSELPGLSTPNRDVIGAIHAEASPAIEAARRSLHACLPGNEPFHSVARSAQLTPLETEVFAVACAVEVDPRRQRLVGFLNDDVTQRRLTLFTLELLFPEHPDICLAAGPGSGLRRAALIVHADPGPLSSVVIAPSPTVMWWLAGDQTRDSDLAQPVEAREGARNASLTAPEGMPRVLLVPGKDRTRRLQAAESCLGQLLASPLPASPTAWDALVRQATLEARAVVLEVPGPLPAEAARRIEQASHLSWALASPEELPLDCLPDLPWWEVPAAPAPASGHELASLLGSVSLDGSPNQNTSQQAQGVTRGGRSVSARLQPLAIGLGLSAEQLELVRRAAPGLGNDIAAAARRLAAGHISTLAQRTSPSRGWEDLVLDPERTERLREVVARCLHRRTVYDAWGFSPQPLPGVVALFVGPPGTGKTLAAEVIAGELGLDLYKVDLAGLVSKWVGETEKNLAAVFSAAEASNVALFFDEADAIFGKRSQVSDAHDRYANIEVAYLLQRLETYEGLVVMASNLATNIDPAFMRRVSISVDFPMPEETERRRIWERSLPAPAPCEDLDLDLLAKLFKLSGGSIRNAALTGAFLAADADSPITMECLVEAVKREMYKLGRLVDPKEFGPYSALVGKQNPSRSAPT